MMKPSILDLRSLALMRIVVGLLLFLVVLARMVDLGLYYTDDGYVSRHIITERYWNAVWWSLHLFSGERSSSGALFAFHAAAALALAAGWKTRASSVVCYLLTLSMYNRNPLVLDGGDREFLLVLFWGMALPWGEFYSVDRRGAPVREPASVSVGGLGYLLQMVQIYLMAGLWKLHPVWLTELTALERALSLGQFCKPVGSLLLGFPSLLAALSLATVLLEWLAPLVILAGNGWARGVAVISLILFHACIALILDLGFFPWLSLACLLGLLPSTVWDFKNGVCSDRPTVVLQSNIFMSAAAYLAMLVTMWWNLYLAFHNTETPDPTGPWRVPTAIASASRLAQTWNLFAPVPRTEDSRYFVEAMLADGRRVDLLRKAQPFPQKEPQYRYREFQNQRQRMYLTALELSVAFEFRTAFLAALARNYLEAHPGEQIVWLRLTVERIPTWPRNALPPRRSYELARLVPDGGPWIGPLPSNLGPPPKS